MLIQTHVGLRHFHFKFTMKKFNLYILICIKQTFALIYFALRPSLAKLAYYLKVPTKNSYSVTESLFKLQQDLIYHEGVLVTVM